MDYTSHTEAPRHMHFWTGVSTLAGALQRKVWVDQAYFKWYPNLYIVLVAPPGIVSKSTTAGLGMDLLRQVQGVAFGPEIVTWPALVDAFEAASDAPLIGEAYYPQSALTLESSEFGVLLDPQDKGMVDLLVSLWDGKQGKMEKKTKTSGNNSIENPWINIIACTTPSWIAGNFPEYMVGGGFTSRTLFVYADAKAKLVAYPFQHVPPDHDEKKQKLVDDLQYIFDNVRGEYRLTPRALEWGEHWYNQHYTQKAANLSDDDRFGGYLARKQTMIHKVGMIVAASSGDSMYLTEEHLNLAATMITDLEPDLQFVFSKIGRSPISVYTERLVSFVHSRGAVGYTEAYRYVHTFFSSMRDFEDILAGCIKAGYIKWDDKSGMLVKGIELPKALNGNGK